MITMKKMAPVFLLLCLFLIQCSATPKKRSFGEVVDDNVVALKLRSKFMHDKEVKASDINVKVWKGTATLTGSVDTQDQINRAIEIAEQQAGVREVRAYLVLKDMPGVTQKSEKKPLSAITNLFNNKGNPKTVGKSNNKNPVVVSDLSDTNSQLTTTKSANENKNKVVLPKKNKTTTDDSDFEDIQY